MISSLFFLIFIVVLSFFWIRKNIKEPVSKVVHGLSGVAASVFANIEQVATLSTGFSRWV